MEMPLIIGGEPISVLLLASIAGSSLVEQNIVILLLSSHGHGQYFFRMHALWARADDNYILGAGVLSYRIESPGGGGRVLRPQAPGEELSPGGSIL